MQTLSALTKKATLQNKRNLFGLGFTSLIAACGSAADSGGGNSDGKTPDNGGKPHDNGIATYTPTVDLPNEVVKAAELSKTMTEGKSGFTAILDGDMDKFTVAITDDTNSATLTFSDGADVNINTANIYQLTTATDIKYDLVVSSYTIGIGTDTNPDYQKGGIFIFWNMAAIMQDETIGAGSTTTTNQRLEIKGANAKDKIGEFAPEFLQIGGKVNNYDMVFGGRGVNRVIDVSDSDVENTGAMYILWDVADYAGSTKTIDLGSLAVATSGSLAIYGATTDDEIGEYAPQLLELGSADNAYDMVIRSHKVDKDGEGVADYASEGAIYVLWDVAGYHDTEALHKTVTLDNSLVDNSGAYTNGATYGLLAIYGGYPSDWVGIHAPEFLQLGGVAGNKLDMVISTHRAYRVSVGIDYTNEGAIYILWDVADYAGKNKVIDLGKLDDSGLGANAGSLVIYGSKVSDQIGTYAPEFLQIGGKNNNQDMVIRSQVVDNVGDGINNHTNEGAIYILWDVADYYSAGTDKNQSIDLATPADATSGLLTIYGRGNNAKLGHKDDDNNINNNILYNANDELTNIDSDTDGTKDIALTDGKYTYIFFGNQIADTGDDNEVDSKTIDLGAIETLLTADTAGFFGYDFTANDGLGEATTKTATKTTDSVGYRYANDDHTTLAAIALNPPPFSLSDTDADLGVWDIA